VGVGLFRERGTDFWEWDNLFGSGTIYLGAGQFSGSGTIYLERDYLFGTGTI
jgi:hypothetical protein